MNPAKSRALILRIQGYSYSEIREKLDVPVAKSTLSVWLRDTVLSTKARARLDAKMRTEGAMKLAALNKLQTPKAEKRARAQQRLGRLRTVNLDRTDLCIVGPLLYWAEGYKRLKVVDGKERMNHKISFVNADAEMISIFVQFLCRILCIPKEKIRLTMRLYIHINEKEAREHWMHATKLPQMNFYKTTYPVSGASKGVRPYNRLPYGTLQVEVCDTPKFHYLMGMLAGVKEQLLRDKMSELPG